MNGWLKKKRMSRCSWRSLQQCQTVLWRYSNRSTGKDSIVLDDVLHPCWKVLSFKPWHQIKQRPAFRFSFISYLEFIFLNKLSKLCSMDVKVCTWFAEHWWNISRSFRSAGRWCIFSLQRQSGFLGVGVDMALEQTINASAKTVLEKLWPLPIPIQQLEDG